MKTERERGFAVAAVMKAARGLQVRISKPTRTEIQNAAIHACLSDIADQLPWPKDTGELHDIVWWKRVCTLGWLIETKQEKEFVKSLEGEEFAFLLPHTSDLDVAQCAALREWIWSFGATNGVVFKEPKCDPKSPPREDER